jgi:hypothetical protein
VFDLFWLLIVILLELIAIRLSFIFFYALIGAAGAGELRFIFFMFLAVLRALGLGT